jgi:polyketide synthase PksJ
VDSAAYDVLKGKSNSRFSIPIGKPMPNFRLYILGPGHEVKPVGAVGELCISGTGVGRGYVNKPELSGVKFVANPFVSGETMYRTGDMVRWMPCGNIEFIGRQDDQVKVRGFRIELGEIEKVISSHKGVKKAVVTVKGDGAAAGSLCAYIVPAHPDATAGKIDESELRHFLTKKLPGYMVPSYFIPTAEIPLTVNGKVDRKALPEPELKAGDGYVAPGNEIERALTRVWAEVLEIDREAIGVKDNFFEIGGHSLRATILIARLHKELNVKVPLIEIFKTPTITGIAGYIMKTGEERFIYIKPVEKKEYYELSSPQKRLYILQQMDLESTVYNMPYMIHLKEEITGPRLQEIFREILTRHDSLRTSFTLIDNTPVQKINVYRDNGFTVEIPDHRPGTGAAGIMKDFVRPFDLSRSPLLRARLIKTGEKGNMLLYDMHHIITDGTSQDLLENEFLSLSQGQDLSPLRLQYKDYVQWRSRKEHKQSLKRQEEYWRRIFTGDVPALDLPADYPRPLERSFAGAAVVFVLSEQETRFIRAMVNESGATLFMVILAIYNIFLAKLSGRQDIIVGIPVAGRRHADLENIIGMFVNMLALRNEIRGEKTVQEIIKEIMGHAITAYENQEYQFEDLVDHLAMKRDTGRNPVFDVVFTLLNQEEYREEFSEEAGQEDYRYREVGAKFDLMLTVVDYGKNFSLVFEYCTDLFKRGTIEKFIGYFRNILTQMAGMKERKLSEIEIITAKEKEDILYRFNDTKRDYPANKTVHRLFEEQAVAAPDKRAVVFRDSQITYRELNSKANGMAKLLRKKGVKPGVIVGIMVERSVEMMWSIIGILKAGGAYLPLDKDYPGERKNYMAADIGLHILLSGDTEGLHGCGSVETINVHHKDFYKKAGQRNLKHTGKATDLVYILYTSGSTGKPKGVMVEHKNVVRLIKNTNFISFEAEDRLLQTGSLDFDASTLEIWGSILNGITLCLAQKNDILIPGVLQNILKKNRITLMWLTASLFNRLSDEDITLFEGLRKLLIGGEALSPLHIGKLKKTYPGIALINGYGPTENVTFSTTYLIDKEHKLNIPIGKPIANSSAYILGPGAELLPPNVPGELFVGGDGVSWGYLNNPELTAEKFINHKLGGGPKTRLYNTGDIARRLPDGNIEYTGRRDHQVKIRGFRVELGEIENELLRFDIIKEAAVVIKKDRSGDKYLCGYIVSEQEIDTNGIKDRLLNRLPSYMVPLHFEQLAKIPLNMSGKVDREALQTIETKLVSRKDYIPPRNEVEKKLVEIWAALLGIAEDAIGVDDNFFDLGGNSLKIIRLSSILKKTYRKDIPVVKFFRYTNISSLAGYLTGEDEQKKSSSVARKRANAVVGRDIAVIGMAGRFPGAANIDEYWENLKQGVESISFFSDEELDGFTLSGRQQKDKNYVKAVGLLQDIEYFDASFFGYIPNDALLMEPQIRIFHEIAWEALEDAGCAADAYDGLIGVFAGGSINLYWGILSLLSGQSGIETLHLTNKDFMSTQVSYKLNLRGESSSVQTACSTSLTAIHHGIRSLHAGDCHIALAGGVYIKMPQRSGYKYQEGMIKSPDGHCRTFDAKAGGFVGGCGVGAVVLKPLADALSDGDNIYAVVKGSAINNDGSRKVGYAAPSIEGQVQVVQDAIRRAGIAAETIGYIETHGTATALGDPVEIDALRLAFNTGEKGFCGVGSVKTNIGHLNSAAGVAGFIKTVLILKNRLITPTLHFEASNPEIDFENSPFYVTRELSAWRQGKYPARAGVSALGIGGTNVHIILEEAPQDYRKNPPVSLRDYQLILLSAKTAEALNALTGKLTAHLKKNPGTNPADLAYTLQAGRKVFKYRKMSVVSSTREAVDILSGAKAGKMSSFRAREGAIPVVFMFSGQGSQYVNMGLELYRKEPQFRHEMDECFRILGSITDDNIKDILYPENLAGAVDAQEKVDDVFFSGPIKLITEYSLAKLLLNWGIKPHALIGHSFGEYTAACLSGVFSLEDALKLVVLRGRLMGKTPPGAMLAVTMPEKELRPMLNKTLSLAAVNSIDHCIVSGLLNDVAELENRLKEEGRDCMRINYPRASHSKVMASAAEEFKNFIKRVELKEPQIPYISGLTGTWITAQQAADPDYWARHLTGTILFSKGVEELLKEPHALFLQVGSDRGLPKFVGYKCTDGKKPLTLNLIRHPQEKISDVKYLLDKIGRLWLHGAVIDWQIFYGEEKRFRLSLPTYPFERQRFWPEGDLFKLGMNILADKKGLQKKEDMADWFYIPSWEQTVLGASPSTRRGAGSNWLLFIDKYGLGRKLTAHLKEKIAKVAFVQIGSEFSEEDEANFTIRPGFEDDYDRLFDRLSAAGMVPEKIIHMWGITGEEEHETPWDSLSRLQEQGLHSLLNLARAIGRRRVTNPVRIYTIGDHMHEVTGDETVQPGKAAVLGPVKIIPIEYPEIGCLSIDIVLPQTGGRQEKRLIEQLAVECLTDSPEQVIAYRGDYRWVSTIRPARIEEPEEPENRFRNKGVYLMTGGMGGMGFTLAEYLAKSFKARLALIGRSPFPARKDWQSWLADHGEADPVSLKIRKIQECEAGGAAIMVRSADVSDPVRMKEVVAETEEKFGKINGVIHTAGVIDYEGVIQRRTKEQTEKVMKAKVNGTLVLDALLGETGLDFFIIFSSIGNILYKGKFGQVGYNAANEFLDAYAYFRKRKDSDLFVMTLNWNDWSEVGMSALAVRRGYDGDEEDVDFEALMTDAISPAQGVEVFKRAMSSSLNRILVSATDLKLRRDRKDPWFEGRVNLGVVPEEKEAPRTLYKRPELSSEYAAPGNSAENKLVETFQSYFGFEQLGIYDDFFELGGDSLGAMALTSSIHKAMGVKIPIPVFFNNPTISGLSQYIKEGEKEIYISINPREEKEYYPLSSVQKRLYVLQQMDPESIGYNFPYIVHLRPDIDRNTLVDCFDKLFERHEILRTSFTMAAGDEPVQVIRREIKCEVEYYEVNEKEKDGEGEEEGRRFDIILDKSGIKRRILTTAGDLFLEALLDYFIRPFDLSSAPILRLGLVETPNNANLLLLDMHHIVTDKSSQGILEKEFTALSKGEELFPLPLQYKDYAQWQNSRQQQEAMKQHESYWVNAFSGEIPELDLPLDFSRPLKWSFEGAQVTTLLPAAKTSKLKTLAKKQDVTFYVMLLSIFNILLSKLSGQGDIIVGCGIAGRSHDSLRDILGMFVNLLAIRNYPDEEKNFKPFLNEVKKRVLDSFEHQEYQFEDLVRKVSLERKSGRSPLFDVAFNLTNMSGSERKRSKKEESRDYHHEISTAKYDLILSVVDLGEEVQFSFQYCTKLFKPETIERFIDYFKLIISSVIDSPGCKLGDIKIIEEAEQQELFKIERLAR